MSKIVRKVHMGIPIKKESLVLCVQLQMLDHCKKLLLSRLKATFVMPTRRILCNSVQKKFVQITQKFFKYN